MKKQRYIIGVLAACLAVSLYFNFRKSDEECTHMTDSFSVEYVEHTDTAPKEVDRRNVGEMSVVVQKSDAHGNKPTTFGKNYMQKSTTSAENYIIGTENGKNYAQEPAENIPTYSQVDSCHVKITIPRTQKVYSDSTYTAWVSGYRPNLDSIRVRERIVTHTITQTRYRQHRFNVGIVAGCGYGVINRKPDVFIGVGGSWRLW